MKFRFRQGIDKVTLANGGAIESVGSIQANFRFNEVTPKSETGQSV
jgi:hypothetical protein